MEKSTCSDSEKPPLWKGFLPLVVLSVFATQDAVVSAYGEICKPIALFCLKLLGFATVDHGTNFTVEQLDVPWTRDCAGMNLLLVLLAIFAWMNRNVKQDRSYWVRMLLVLPPAILANVFRILTLVFYRFVVFPEVESPQLHYFFGFIWLIPFALLSIPRNTERPKKALWFELLHNSAVMGLLAPLLTLPNHWITGVGVVFCLVNCRFTDTFHLRHVVALTLWVGSGPSAIPCCSSPISCFLNGTNSWRPRSIHSASSITTAFSQLVSMSPAANHAALNSCFIIGGRIPNPLG